jgi:hypothetical protein
MCARLTAAHGLIVTPHFGSSGQRFFLGLPVFATALRGALPLGCCAQLQISVPHRLCGPKHRRGYVPPGFGCSQLALGQAHGERQLLWKRPRADGD